MRGNGLVMGWWFGVLVRHCEWLLGWEEIGDFLWHIPIEAVHINGS